MPLSLVWDPRSGLAICELCHARHTSAFRRIPRSCLTAANWAFINELGLDWWIARYYPGHAPTHPVSVGGDDGEERKRQRQLVDPETGQRVSIEDMEPVAVLGASLTGTESSSPSISARSTSSLTRR